MLGKPAFLPRDFGNHDYINLRNNYHTVFQIKSPFCAESYDHTTRAHTQNSRAPKSIDQWTR